jgi:threonine dehydratase
VTDVVTTADIWHAACLLRPVVRCTPLEPNQRLSGELGVPVLLKREDLQLCRSYKVRGAYNLISTLSENQRKRGIVCASAGNHGQGVAHTCTQLGTSGRVYLPVSTPRQKRERVCAIGHGVIQPVLVGSDFAEASTAALQDCCRTGAIYVHPFDDPRVVAGQGTVAVEIAEQCRDRIDTVIVPVGGGGLLAGMLLWLKHQLPDAYVIGAEPAGAASMRAALAHHGPVRLEHVDAFVDGAAVSCVGFIGYEVASGLLDEIVSVPEDVVCAEMVDLYQTDGIIAEPAGALASAAARMPLQRSPQGNVVCVVSGGNNDIYRYGEVLARARRYRGQAAEATSRARRPA